ncbi:MAG: hypothetical protein AAFN59_00860 [Pseudomonadota bacterium]
MGKTAIGAINMIRLAAPFRVFLVSLSLILGASFGPAIAQEASEASATLDTLLETLKDETARNALIAELEALAGAQDAQTSEPEAPLSIADQMASFTTSAVEDLVSISQKLITDIGRIRLLFTSVSAQERQTALAEGFGLLGTVLTTSVIFLGLYRLLKRIFVTSRHERHIGLSPKALTLLIHLFVGSPNTK